jgi:hypothetical protein
MRTKILLLILLITCIAVGSYHGIRWYKDYDLNKIKVRAGDCLAHNPTPTGLDLFIYVHKVNPDKKWIYFYVIDPRYGAFVAAAPTKVFNKRMEKYNTKFVDCKTLKILRDF